MKIAGTYKTFAKSLVFLGVLSLAQLAQATESVGKGDKLAYDAKKQIGVTTSYDPTYRQLDFPRGDVPMLSYGHTVCKISIYSSWSIKI